MSTPAPQTQKSATAKFLDASLPFILGGMSGITATCFIQPMDMIKVRIQIKSEELAKLKAEGKPATGSVSPFVVIKEILAGGGPKAFYRG
jgi:solute carrier family 25 (mitochondrial oxoglutarate transporter), member 11